MNILTIDSSTDLFGASLIRDDMIVGECAFQRPKGQLVNLLPQIMGLFETTGIEKRAIDLIAVTSGPGSFTGLRLGAATARTLAQLLNVRIAALNTLDCISRNLALLRERLCVAQDARKGELFCSFYEPGGRNRSGYLTLRPEQLIEHFGSEHSPCVVTGNGLISYGKMIQAEPGLELYLLPSWYWYPHPQGMLTLIREACEEGRLLHFYELETFYLRPPDAKPGTHVGESR
jgi:tRNA threonylcarbamoyladenosine biosynthesis protein TsaB